MSRPVHLAILAMSALAISALAMSALAGAAFPARAQHLNAAMAAPITTIDPHFYNAAPNNGLALHIFERLVERTPTAQLRRRPRLIESGSMAITLANGRRTAEQLKR